MAANYVVAATTASFVFALIAVALRLYARIVLVKRLYGEDYILTTSFVVALSWWIVKVVGATRHADSGNIRLLAIISWYGTIAWGLSSALTKLSIVYQYWRVFEDIRWVRQLCNYMMGFLGLYGLYSFFGAIFQCLPVEHAWMGAPGTCANPEIYYFLTSSVNIVADLIIFAIPVWPVMNLKIPQKQRLALLICFTFGAFTIICSIVRLYWLVESLEQKLQVESIEKVTVWAGIEMVTSIICTCFPVLRPLMIHWFPKLMSGSLTSSAKSRLSRNHCRGNNGHQQDQQQQQEGQGARKPRAPLESESSAGSGEAVEEHHQEQQQQKQPSEQQFYELDSLPSSSSRPSPLAGDLSNKQTNLDSLQEQGAAGIPQPQPQPYAELHQQHIQKQQAQQHRWSTMPKVQHQHTPRPLQLTPVARSNSSSPRTSIRSLTNAAPPYQARTGSPVPYRISVAPQRPHPTAAAATEEYMPVSPQSTTDGSFRASFRASTVSALSQVGVGGSGTFLEFSSSSSSSGYGGGRNSEDSSRNSIMMGRGLHPAPALRGDYYNNISFANTYPKPGSRGSSRSSIYSRHSSSAHSRRSSGAGSAGGIASRAMMRATVSSFGAVTTRSSSTRGSVAMDTIVDHHEGDEDREGLIMGNIADHKNESSQKHTNTKTTSAAAAAAAAPAAATGTTTARQSSTSQVSLPTPMDLNVRSGHIVAGDMTVAPLDVERVRSGRTSKALSQTGQSQMMPSEDSKTDTTTTIPRDSIDTDAIDSSDDEDFICGTAAYAVGAGVVGGVVQGSGSGSNSRRTSWLLKPSTSNSTNSSSMTTTTTTTTTTAPSARSTPSHSRVASLSSSRSSTSRPASPASPPTMKPSILSPPSGGATEEVSNAEGDEHHHHQQEQQQYPPLTPIKPMPKLVLPPLFFQPEHDDYDKYRLSKMYSALPPTRPPSKGLPALPNKPSQASLRGGGEEDRRAVSPFEVV